MIQRDYRGTLGIEEMLDTMTRVVSFADQAAALDGDYVMFVEHLRVIHRLARYSETPSDAINRAHSSGQLAQPTLVRDTCKSLGSWDR